MFFKPLHIIRRADKDKYNGSYEEGFYFVKTMPDSWDIPIIPIPPLDSSADKQKAFQTFEDCKTHVFDPYMINSRYAF